MDETRTLGLPLVQPSQAQKHVTVNEALVRLDGLAQITLQSRYVNEPPAGFVDGDCYAVPTGATADWSGRDGALAIASNGGWIFVTPQDGWTGWIVDEAVRATFFQGKWLAGMATATANGASSHFVAREAEYEISAGGAQAVGLIVPADSVLFACSARIAEGISGDLSSWTLDLDDGSVTFGTGMGLETGSYCTGILSQPTTVYAAKDVRVSPVGNTFASGKLRLALHYYRIELPV